MIRCWLFGHKAMPGPPLWDVQFELGACAFTDGAQVRLCKRCHGVYWAPVVDHERRWAAVRSGGMGSSRRINKVSEEVRDGG